MVCTPNNHSHMKPFPCHPSQLQPPIPAPEPQPAPAPAKRRRKLTIAKQEPDPVAGKTPPTSH